MTDGGTELKINLSADQVSAFLQQHPDFFSGRDDLLAQMKLPHKRGSSISLFERQLYLFRRREEERQRRLDYLTETARANEQRFENLRKMTLSLLESRDIEQAIESVADSLTHDFNIDFHHLLFFF